MGQVTLSMLLVGSNLNIEVGGNSIICVGSDVSTYNTSSVRLYGPGSFTLKDNSVVTLRFESGDIGYIVAPSSAVRVIDNASIFCGDDHSTSVGMSCARCEFNTSGGLYVIGQFRPSYWKVPLNHGSLGFKDETQLDNWITTFSLPTVSQNEKVVNFPYITSEGEVDYYDVNMFVANF